jgi:hypothetical protein
VEGLNEIKVVKLPTPGDLFLLLFFLSVGMVRKLRKASLALAAMKRKALFKTYFQKARFHDI